MGNHAGGRVRLLATLLSLTLVGVGALSVDPTGGEAPLGPTVAIASGSDLPVSVPAEIHRSNATSYDGQGFFVQDALYDDAGADTSDSDLPSVLTGFEGDAWPQGTQTGVGDIRSVRVLPKSGDPDAVIVEVTMNNLHLTTKQLAAPPQPLAPAIYEEVVTDLSPGVFIGIDDGAGGFSYWPYGANLHTPGIDHGFILTFDDFARYTDGVLPVPVAHTVNGHTVSVEVDGLRDETIKLVVGAGEWDHDLDVFAGQLLDPDRPILDLAGSCDTAWRLDKVPYHGPNPPRDDAACEWAQSEDLAAKYPDMTTHSFLEIDRTKLGTDEPAPAPPSGWHSYVFRSAISNGVGDGLWKFTGNPQFLGEYQGFTVALPPDWVTAQDHDLVVYLHGGAAWGTLQAPFDDWNTHLQRSDRVVLYPYGRGSAPWWYAAGEVDMLEALAALEDIVDVHPDRRVLSGISHGGYGTYLMGWRHPDLWAGLITYMATNDNQYSRLQSDPELPTWHTDAILQNGYNIPILLLAGTEQTLHEMTWRVSRLDEEGYEHDYKLFPQPGHGILFTDEVGSHVVAWLDGLADRVVDPRRVRFTVVPSWNEDVSGHPYRGGAGLAYSTRAYWVSGVAANPAVDIARVDATSYAIAYDATRISTPYVTPVPGGDPPPLLASGRIVTHDPGPVAQQATVTLEGAAALTLDLGRMGLASGATIDVSTSATTTISVTGGTICSGQSSCVVSGTQTLTVD